MDSVSFLIIAALTSWILLFLIAHLILRRATNVTRTSKILVTLALVVGVLVPLFNSGDDPIPAYLLGQMFGSVLAFGVPVMIAVALEWRKRVIAPRQTGVPPMSSERIASLERLAKLRQDGFLSDEEFQMQKGKLLK